MAVWLKRGALADQNAAIDTKVRETVEVTLADIEAPLTRPLFKDQAFKAGVPAKIKLGRIGSVEDLMGAILFLASDASALMTGTNVVVDGGWTAE
jgi:NAD(P)-dependent dehydrogenase (short-subunit alcohol dehydrogenase family)